MANKEHVLRKKTIYFALIWTQCASNVRFVSSESPSTQALVVALSSSSASVFPEAPPRLLVLSLQALGNVSVHAPEAVFSACTGETRCWVACTSTASPAILGPVAMAVYNCARRIGPHPADVLCPLTSEILPGLISSFSAAHRHRLQEAPAGTSRSPDSHDSAAAPSLSDHAVAERVQEGEAAHQTHVEGTEWLALLLLHLALMPKADGTARSGVEGEGQADGVVEEKGGFAGERARVGVGGVLRSLPGEDAVFALELMAEEMDSNSGHWSSKARSPPPSLGHDLSALLDGALSRGDTAFLHGVLALARAVLSTAADGDGGTAIDEHNNDGEAGATAKTMAEENGHAGVASGRPSKDEREGTASGIQRLPGTLAGHWAAETGLIRSVLRVLRRLGLPPPPETRKGREGGGSGGGGRGGGEEREKGGRDADEGERGEGRASQGECGEGREGGQAGRGSHLRGNSEMEGPMRSVGCAEQPPWAYYGCRTDALACLACASYRW